MGTHDLAFAARCTADVGWASETLAVFEDFHRHDPQGCFIASLEGEATGICVATPYTHSGFVGELIVRAEARRRGIGAALLEHAVGYLRQRGIGDIYLDGVLAAVPLYERHGFRKVCRSLRLSGQMAARRHAQVRRMRREDLPQVNALDRRYFGDERSYFLRRRLERCPELCLVQAEAGTIQGYLMGRRGEGFVAAGPGVCAGEEPDPRLLLESFALQAGESGFSLGVLETSAVTADLLRASGFSERPDSPWRMALGPGNDLGASPQCFAVGSAATG